MLMSSWPAVLSLPEKNESANTKSGPGDHCATNTFESGCLLRDMGLIRLFQQILWLFHEIVRLPLWEQKGVVVLRGDGRVCLGVFVDFFENG